MTSYKRGLRKAPGSNPTLSMWRLYQLSALIRSKAKRDFEPLNRWVDGFKKSSVKIWFIFQLLSLKTTLLQNLDKPVQQVDVGRTLNPVFFNVCVLLGMFEVFL